MDSTSDPTRVRILEDRVPQPGVVGGLYTYVSGWSLERFGVSNPYNTSEVTHP